MPELTELGITALKRGHREAALRLLTEAVTRDPRDAMAWLWLSGVVNDDDQRVDCLQRVLELEPGNAAARAGLEQLKAQHGLPLECSACGHAGRITCPACAGSRTELCSTCQGQTFRKCDACHGLGWIPATAAVFTSRLETWKECDRCQVTGLVDCEACRGHGREWCHACEGGGQIICPDCAASRLAILGESLTEAVLCAIRHDAARAQALLARSQGSSPLAGFLWRVGFADRPYHSTRRLQMWIESHPDDRAARHLLALLPAVPYEQLPPRDKPVQLLKRQRPAHDLLTDRAADYVLPKGPNAVVRDGIMAARIGNRDQALLLLLQAVEQDPRSEEAWLWLVRLVDTDAQRAECLRRVLEINPGNQAARQDLARLTATHSAT